MTLKGCFFGIIKFVFLVGSLMVVGALSTFITLRLFTTGGEAVVPDLRGKDPVEAIQVLKQTGLHLKVMPQKRFSDQVAADRIVAQRPDPNSRIKEGRTVEVYMSLGPEKAIVPDLLGQTPRVAALTLEQQGLIVGKVIHVNDDKSEPEEILSQYPVAGTELIGSKIVNLVVNSTLGAAHSMIMPDVIGMKLGPVEDYFRANGLRVGVTQGVRYPGIPSGTIVKQNPPSGYRLSKETAIGLYYSN